MKRLIIAFALALSICGNVFACMGKLMPDEDFGKYSQIFIGEVSGIHLVGYEKDRLKSLSRGNDRRWFTDITQTQNLTLIVTKVLVGKPDALMKVEVGGCGVVTPNPAMLGIFFVSKEDGHVIPIYETEGKHYYELLLKLGEIGR